MARFLIGAKAEQLFKKLNEQNFGREQVQSAVKQHDLANEIVEGIYIDMVQGCQHFCVFAIYAVNGDCFCENFSDKREALKWLLEE